MQLNITLMKILHPHEHCSKFELTVMKPQKIIISLMCNHAPNGSPMFQVHADFSPWRLAPCGQLEEGTREQGQEQRKVQGGSGPQGLQGGHTDLSF